VYTLWASPPIDQGGKWKVALKEVIDARRFSFDYVLKYIKQNSSAELISDTYINANMKMDFKCECGNPFKTTFRTFKNNNKHHCDECGKKIARGKLEKQSSKKFIYEDVRKFFEDHGCTLLSNEYKNCDSKLDYICNCGEKSQITFYKFKKGQRCKSCGGKKAGEWTQVGIQDEVEKYLGDRGYYMKYKYVNNRIKLDLICPNGHNPRISWSNFKKGRRCSFCAEKSYGNKQIADFLEESEIAYEREVAFDECAYKKKLPFDIFIENKILIEYDGRQHFEPVDFGNKGQEWAIDYFAYNLKRDQIKNEFCVKNKIPLIRIPHWEFDNIETILNHVLGYFNIRNYVTNNGLVEKFLVNHVDWSQEKYIAETTTLNI
jgi:hypothetical protein